MSGPVSPPLATTESGTSTIVRPTNTLEFNGADFTVTGSGSKATISIDSTGTGAALSDGQIGFGSSANLLTGSSLLTYDDTAGSELVTIKGSGTSTLLKLESTEAGASVAPILDLFRNSASPDTGDDLGQILFSGNDSAGAKQNYFQIKGEIRDKTSGSDDGELIFIGPSNSTDIEFVRMSKTVGVVVNEGGGGIVDFRVETSNNTAILASDASNDNLGVGTSSPNANALLHITDDGTKANTVRIESTDNDTAVGPVLDMRRNNADGTSVAGDKLGVIQFTGLDSGGGAETYNRFIAEIKDPDTTQAIGRMKFMGLDDGSELEYFRYESGASTFNELGVNIDFRIEGQNDGSLFRTDASQDNIGIGGLPSSSVEKLHIQGTGTSTLVRLESSDTGATVAPNMQFLRNSGSPAVSDEIGSIQFIGKDDGGNDTSYGQIKCSIQDETGGTEDGWLQFGASFAGTLQPNMLTIRGDVPAVVVNEGSGDIDFRVESNANANMFKVDGGQNNVGIGTAPDSTALLHIQDDGTFAATLRVESTDTDADSGPVIEFFRNSASPAAGDDLGYVNFSGENASGSKVSYAAIRVDIDDTTASGEDASLNFLVTRGGSARKLLRARYSEVVVNEDSDDVDFRVESNSNTNMFRVDGGLNLVGISAAPTSGGATLQIPDNTISHYCNVNSIRSDAVGIMVMVNEDNQGQMWVHESASAHTIQLVEGGVKGQHFQFMSTDGNITIDPQGTDTLNGGTASLTRSTNFEIYDVFCYDTGKWALSNPA